MKNEPGSRKEDGVDYGPYDVYYHLGFPSPEEEAELRKDPHNRYEQFIEMEEWIEAEREQAVIHSKDGPL